jgi:hypothetical protein
VVLVRHRPPRGGCPYIRKYIWGGPDASSVVDPRSNFPLRFSEVVLPDSERNKGIRCEVMPQKVLFFGRQKCLIVLTYVDAFRHEALFI